jgi:hypothetical protein
MIRLIHCVRRRPDISIEAFRRFWNRPEFSQLLEQVVRITRASRAQKNVTLLIDLNDQLMNERGAEEPFDGIIEVWWEQAKGFQEMLDAPETRQALEQMTDFQQQFIDFSRSYRFFTEWDGD